MLISNPSHRMGPVGFYNVDLHFLDDSTPSLLFCSPNYQSNTTLINEKKYLSVPDDFPF